MITSPNQPAQGRHCAPGRSLLRTGRTQHVRSGSAQLSTGTFIILRSLEPAQPRHPGTMVSKQRRVGSPARLQGCMTVNGMGREVGSAPARSHWPRLIGTRSSWGNARQACFKGTLLFVYVPHLPSILILQRGLSNQPQARSAPVGLSATLIGPARVARRLTLDASVSRRRASSGPPEVNHARHRKNRHGGGHMVTSAP